MDSKIKNYISVTLSEIFETHCLYGKDIKMNNITKMCIVNFFENLNIFERKYRMEITYIESIVETSQKTDKNKIAEQNYNESRRQLVLYYLNHHHEVLFYIIFKFVDAETRRRNVNNWDYMGPRVYISCSWFPSKTVEWQMVNFSLMVNLFS